MDNPAENLPENIAEDERSSGKRKLDEASEAEDLSDEEGFPTGRVRRMRVSETADKNGGASGGVNAVDLSELTTDSKAHPNHQKHGTASPAPAANGPANENLGNGPLNPSPRGTPHANGPGHVGRPQSPSPFEATPDSFSLPSSVQTVPAAFSFPSSLEAPHSSRAALSVNNESLPSEGSLAPSDTNGDALGHAPPNLVPVLPLQAALNSTTNIHNDDQQLESGAIQGSPPVNIDEGRQDEEVLAWDTSVALLGLGLAPSGGQNATEGETIRDPEMEDASAGSEDVLGGGLEETAGPDGASESEQLEPTSDAVPSFHGATPALEAEQSDEEQAATSTERRLSLDNHGCEATDDDVMGGEISGEVGLIGGEARMGPNAGAEVRMGEIGCDEVGGDDIEYDVVSGGEADVSRQTAEQERGAAEQFGRAELASGAAQLQLLVKLFDGRTVLVRADPSEGAETVLEKVRVKTGIDCVGQRLLYNGRELPPL